MSDTSASERDEQAVTGFVEHMAMSLADWGFPRMPARILMTMMAADEQALTAADLAERVGVSPAAISGGVRYLLQINMIDREPVPGSRLVRYRLPADAWYEVTAGKNQLFKTLSNLAGEGVTALGGPGTPSGRRVAQMRDYFAFVNEELPRILDRWRAYLAAHEAKTETDG